MYTYDSNITLGIQEKEATEKPLFHFTTKDRHLSKKDQNKIELEKLKAQDVLTSNSEVLVKQANIYWLQVIKL